MKILIGDKGNVDFDDPIPMNKEQQQDFLDFMRTMFQPVTIEENMAFRINRLGDKMFQRKWDDEEEIAMLLDVTMETNEVCTTLGRTWMSVNIKRGQIMPDLMKWADSKGHDLTKGDIKYIIKEYLEKKKEITRINRKMAWDEKNKKKKELDYIRKEIENCKTMIYTIELRIKTNSEFPSDSDKISINRKKIQNLELDYHSKEIELNPNNDVYWNNKGDSLFNLERFDEALECYDEAIEIDHDNDVYWNSKGDSHYNLEMYDEALGCYDKAIEINPDYDEAWCTSASIFSKIGDKEAALSRLAKSIELDGTNKIRAVGNQDFELLWTDPRFKKLIE